MCFWDWESQPFILQTRSEGLWEDKDLPEFNSMIPCQSWKRTPTISFPVSAHPFAVETNLLEKFEKLFSVSQSSSWFYKCSEFSHLPTIIRNGWQSYNFCVLFLDAVVLRIKPTNICPIANSSAMEWKDRSASAESIHCHVMSPHLFQFTVKNSKNGFMKTSYILNRVRQASSYYDFQIRFLQGYLSRSCPLVCSVLHCHLPSPSCPPSCPSPSAPTSPPPLPDSSTVLRKENSSFSPTEKWIPV